MTELRIDYDGRLPADWFLRLQAICRHQQWPVGVVMLRRTRHGWHVLVTIGRDVPTLAVVAAQAIMGSDWKRENFCLYRARYMDSFPRHWRQAKRWNALYTVHHHG